MDILGKTLIVSLFFSVYTQDVDIFEAVRQDNKKQIEAAIGKGVDINIIGQAGQTPLMHAVLTGKLNAVKTLLKLGADTDIGEKDGYTPIHGAAFQGRAEIAKVLIDHGVDPLDEHDDGYMPIHRATWGKEKRHTDTVRVLLENGVPVDEPADNGDKPMDSAKKFGNQGTIKLLNEWMSKKTEL